MSQDRRVIATRQWWLDSLSAAADEVCAALRVRPGDVVARLAGADWDADRRQVRLMYWDTIYTVTWPEVRVLDIEGQLVRADARLIILLYLYRADGTPIAGRWLSFRELPDAGFYHQAFDDYTGGRLVRTIGDAVDRLQKAAIASGGQPEPLGDIGFRFQALPRVWLAVAYWLGDEEVPAQARVLFDAAVGHYLDAAGLAGLGSQLISRLLRVM